MTKMNLASPDLVAFHLFLPVYRGFKFPVLLHGLASIPVVIGTPVDKRGFHRRETEQYQQSKDRHAGEEQRVIEKDMQSRGGQGLVRVEEIHQVIACW
jgi:hypothetical protein